MAVAFAWNGAMMCWDTCIRMQRLFCLACISAMGMDAI